MSTTNPKETTVSQYVRKYFADTNGFSHSTFESLLNGPIEKINSVFDKLAFAAEPVLGGYFPKNWSECRSGRSDPSTNEFSLSLRWTVFKLQYHSKKLAEMVSDRNEIEQILLEGKYKDAKLKLLVLEQTHGVSVWSLGTYFRLCELINGTQFNRTELLLFREGLSKGKSNQWPSYLATILSLKVETGLSSIDYCECTSFLNIDGSEISDYASSYLRYRLISQLPADTKGFADILHFESRHSLLDVFDTLTVMLTQLNTVEVPDDLHEPLSMLANTVNDNTFTAVVYQHLLSNENFDFDSCSDCRMAIQQVYLGDFDAALRHAIRTLNKFPRFCIGYFIMGLSVAHLKSEKAIDNLNSPTQRDIVNAIYQWYSGLKDRMGAIEQLRRFSRFHSGTVLGWGIQDFIDGVDGEFNLFRSERIAVIASPCPLPQHALLRSNTSKGINYLTSTDDWNENKFVRTSIESLLDTTRPDNLRNATVDEYQARRLHLYAILSASRTQFAVACNTFESIRDEHSEYYAVRPDAQILEAICLFEVNDIEQAASITARLYAINSKSISTTHLKKFSHLVCDESLEFDKSNIAWSIIATALRNQNIDDLSLDRVHDFVSDYIESQECVLPTELFNLKSTNLTQEEFVFLRDCCTAEIMESSIWIESQEQLIQERLALCETIRSTMDAPPIGIEGEIGLLMRKLAVVDIAQRIERSLIYVDTDGIKERIPESLADSATRLLAAVAINNLDIKRSLKLLGMPDREGASIVLISVDREQEMFLSIFKRLREQYLFSPELGLDANLSQSIRHGPIISGIRSIFDRSQLITRKTVNGDYEKNSHWLNILGESGTTATMIERAFSQLASSVDSFISRIRDKEIQIKSNDMPTGLLNYEFTDSDIENAVKKIEPMHEVEDVYDIALGLLSMRTEHCLQVVKERITVDWEEELSTMLTEFLKQIESVIPNGANILQLRSSVTDCSTEISRGLEKISVWFAQEDKQEYKAFTIQNLVKTFEEMALKGGQKCVAKIVPGCSGGDCMIQGTYFRSLWDLFFILFDNALKHGGCDETVVVVDIRINEELTSISVTNQITDQQDIVLLADKIEQLNALSLDRSSDLLKLRSEGGSGIAKLHKIVRYEIGNDETEYTIALRLIDNSEVRVEIEIQKGISDACILS